MFTRRGPLNVQPACKPASRGTASLRRSSCAVALRGLSTGGKSGNGLKASFCARAAKVAEAPGADLEGKSIRNLNNWEEFIRDCDLPSYSTKQAFAVVRKLGEVRCVWVPGRA